MNIGSEIQTQPEVNGRGSQLVYEIPINLRVRVAADSERSAVDFATALAYLGLMLVQESGHQQEAQRMAHVENVDVPFELGNPEFMTLDVEPKLVKVFGYAMEVEDELEIHETLAVG